MFKGRLGSGKTGGGRTGCRWGGRDVKRVGRREATGEGVFIYVKGRERESTTKGAMKTKIVSNYFHGA